MNRLLHRLPRRRQRGVGTIVVITLVIIISIFLAFFANTLGYQSSADIAMRAALRSGAIAAANYRLLDGDPNSAADNGSSRWFIDPAVGTSSLGGSSLTIWLNPASSSQVARRIALLVLAGDGTKSGSFASRFSGSLPVLLAQDTAPAGGQPTRDGLDVEVLNPAVDSSMSSCSALNGASCASAVVCTASGVYPQGITSALDGLCYTGPTVVMRARLTVVQTTGSVTMTRTMAAGAGTQSQVLP